MRRVVVVGGGPAAVSAAATLREKGYDGEIVLVTDEPDLPYERPPLSKDFLCDGVTTPLLRPTEWYAERMVNVLTGTRVSRLDLAGQQVELSHGPTLGYDALLLATGVRARPGVTLRDDRVLSLRTATDGRRLRDRLAASTQVVVLGGGFIGCEIAATAVGLGKRVVVVERRQTLMERVLGLDLGRVMTDIHRAAGVQLRMSTVVLDCRATPEGIVVRTDKGTVEGDLVVVGAGCDPNVELAADAGIETGNGIVTDALLQTSAPGVYAAGDVACSYHPWYDEYLRVEHHDTAQRQGAAAARSMLGGEEPFAEPHWFWSDQYGHNVQQVGRSADSDELVIRGSLDDLAFSALWLRGGRITKAIAVNSPRDALAVRKVLFAEHDVRPEELADPGTHLQTLFRPSRAA